jgi:hypothetical protein
MRRVAAELDAGTMSLCRSVPDKNELVNLVSSAATRDALKRLGEPSCP